MRVTNKSGVQPNRPISGHSWAAGRPIAIIAAMEREVHPLVQTWKTRTIDHAGRRYQIFETANAALICGGIGAEAARRATEALIQDVHPVQVLSVGFAGALDSTLHVGDVLSPQIVINPAGGARAEIAAGHGILVTSSTVADHDQKTRFAEAYAAVAVDMEAASVAQGAQAHGIEFRAIKAVSDDAHFEMPPLVRFISAEGKFQTAKFALHIALRPWLWRTAIVLARNSSKASRALCVALADYLSAEELADDQAGDQAEDLFDDQAERAAPKPPTEAADQKFVAAHTVPTFLPHTEIREKP